MSIRDEILAAAVSELLERDESSFRVTAVAKTAGCATSVLYHHFGSRDGLLDAALTEIITAETESARVFLDSLAGAALNAVDVVELMAEFARLSLEAGRQGERSRRARLIGATQTRPAVRAAYRSFELLNAEAHRSLIETLQLRGVLKVEIDPAALALLLRSLDFGWTLDDMNDISQVDSHAWVELIRLIGTALASETNYFPEARTD